MVGHPCRNLPMSGLDKQYPDSARKGGSVADEPSRDGVRTKQTGISRVLQGILERIRRMRKQASRGPDDSFSDLVDRCHLGSVAVLRNPGLNGPVRE